MYVEKVEDYLWVVLYDVGKYWRHETIFLPELFEPQVV